MSQREIIVKNPQGMHLRVAAQVVEACRAHKADVQLCKDCKTANGCSILELLLLEAVPDSVLQVEAQGDEAEALLESLSQIFDEGGGI